MKPYPLLRRLVTAGTLTALLAVGMLPALPAAAATTERGHYIGDDIGDVLATDIEAFVQGKPIRSMNIDGYTAVVAEDLRQYGFDVAWTPADRKVTLYQRPAKAVNPLPLAQKTAQPVGTKLNDVLYTDIRTFYGDMEIPSYNLNGQTAIRLNDLDEVGLVEWNAQARTLAFTPDPAASADAPPMEDAPLVIREVGSVEVKDIKVQQGKVLFQGQPIGKVVDDTPMISLAFMGKALGYKQESISRYSGCGENAICFQNGIYGMLAYPDALSSQPGAPLDMYLYWMSGESDKLPVKAVRADAAGDVLISERDLQQLFGYNSTWDADSAALTIQYYDYKVEDYGVPKNHQNYFYAGKLISYMTGTAGTRPELYFRPVGGGEADSYGSSSAAVGEVGEHEYNGRTGLTKYRFDTALEFNAGSYAYNVEVKVGRRILFRTPFEVNLLPETAESVINYPEDTGFGDISRIRFDQPAQAQGYIETGEAQVLFSGTAVKQVGEGLTVLIERQVYGGGFEQVKKQEVPFENGRFSFRVDAPEDERYLTRVTVQSKVVYPRGSYNKDVARFYVKKAAK